MSLSLLPLPARLEVLPGQSTAELTLGGQADPSLGREGYELHVTAEFARLTANNEAGFFYGRETFQQLVREDKTRPCVRIWDKPRFAWRSLMLDVSRHFFSKPEIIDFLNVMAAHKFNVFHWHLNDTQAWRIEIKKYPLLTQIGSWREKIEWGLDPNSSRHWNEKGLYGGFYTQEDVREIVAHAASLQITVVPEIEMPGHSKGGLMAHPEFTCNGTPWSGVYCAGNEKAFKFLEDVLREVFTLFPSEFIHIGADEVDKNAWKGCPRCEERIRMEGLKGVDELQSYFVRRMEKFINTNGRRLIGWGEILEGGLAPNATVMSWVNMKAGIEAANAGHDVIMTPTSHCYFDLYQAKAGQPKALGGFVPLEQVYTFEPVAPDIAPDKKKHVLGGGGNIWTEFMPNYGHVQFMTYPRACALAETLWSPLETRNWNDFKQRLKLHLARLDKMGVRYARTLE